MSSNVRRRRRTIEERLGAAVRHLRPGDLAGRGEPLPRDRGATRVSGGGPDEDGDRGSHIEHVTLEAAASQTIASGGAGVSWAQIAGPPTERLGFETLSARIAADGSVVAIPIDVTGVLNFTFAGLWASWLGAGDLTVTKQRDGIAESRIYTLDRDGVSTRAFGGNDDGWEVDAGDTLTFTLPNGSGSGQTLTSASLVMKVIEVAASTTPGPWQKVYSGDVWGMVFDGTYWWTTEGESRTVTQRDTTWTSLSTFTTDYVIDRTRGITFDGTDLWVTGDSGGSNDAAKRYSTAGVKQSQFITGGLSTLGIAWDGTDLWVVDSDNLQLAKYDTAGSLIDTVSIPGTRHGLSVHGGRLYVVDMSAATVEIREADGTLVQTIDTSPVTSSPTGVWATSGTLYVAEDNVGVWKRAL